MVSILINDTIHPKAHYFLINLGKIRVLSRIIHQEILSCPENFRDRNAHERHSGALIKHF